MSVTIIPRPCDICGKDLTHEELDGVTVWDLMMTCEKHREYRSCYQTDLARAIAGMPTEFSKEQVERYRQVHRDRLELNRSIKENFLIVKAALIDYHAGLNIEGNRLADINNAIEKLNIFVNQNTF